MVFHILSRDDWERVEGAAAYAPASLQSEGFVHLSASHQLLRTAARFFAGRDDLLVLSIREDRLGARLRFELADGEAFPHLYGPVPRDAIVEVFPLHSARALELATARD